jgi:hypothetical protein
VEKTNKEKNKSKNYYASEIYEEIHNLVILDDEELAEMEFRFTEGQNRFKILEFGATRIKIRPWKRDSKAPLIIEPLTFSDRGSFLSPGTQNHMSV